MKFRKLIRNKSALQALMNAVDDKQECKITHQKTIIKLARMVPAIERAVDLYEKMERGKRYELKKMLKDLPKDVNERSLIVQEYNDKYADALEELQDEEIPEDYAPIIPQINFERIEELKFSPAILGGLLDIGIVKVDDED